MSENNINKELYREYLSASARAWVCARVQQLQATPISDKTPAILDGGQLHVLHLNFDYADLAGQISTVADLVLIDEEKVELETALNDLPWIEYKVYDRVQQIVSEHMQAFSSIVDAAVYPVVEKDDFVETWGA